MKRVNIGIIGLGTIGSGTLRILTQKRALLRQKFGVDFVVTKVCDKEAHRKRRLNIRSSRFTRSYRDILKDPEIDVVVELIGGIHPAREIMFGSLEAGKKVVTANKALLSQELPQIVQSVRRHKARLRFEASVCGGIPLIKALTEGLVVNQVDSIFGIMNGTSNYILTKMMQEECTFDSALARAKKRGFAERNSALDISGLDSAHKLIILAYLAFGKFVALDKVYVKGIQYISPLDIRYAKELGLVIKPLAIAKRAEGNKLEMRVHPTLISNQHPLASVSSVYNAVYVRGDLIGDMLFFGKGAGQLPTASAVVSDVIESVVADRCHAVKPIASVGAVKRIDQVSSKFYIRFMVVDQPGVFAKISGILARYKISIASVSQKEQKGRGRIVPVVMLTHDARERNVAAAMNKIKSLSITRHIVVLHREEI